MNCDRTAEEEGRRKPGALAAGSVRLYPDFTEFPRPE
jgi:hypothetical protein